MAGVVCQSMLMYEAPEKKMIGTLQRNPPKHKLRWQTTVCKFFHEIKVAFFLFWIKIALSK